MRASRHKRTRQKTKTKKIVLRVSSQTERVSMEKKKRRQKTLCSWFSG